MSECKDGYSGLAIDCNQTARWKTVRPAPRLQGYSDSGACQGSSPEGVLMCSLVRRNAVVNSLKWIVLKYRPLAAGRGPVINYNPPHVEECNRCTLNLH